MVTRPTSKAPGGGAPRQPRTRPLLDELLRSRVGAGEAGAEERLRAQTLGLCRALIIASCVANLAWWPFDLLLYGDRDDVLRAFAFFRTSSVALGVIYLLTAERWRTLREHYVAWGTFLGATAVVLIAGALGSLGGMEQPWFASLYLAPTMTFAFLVPLRPRLVSTAIVGGAVVVGFFGLHPENLVGADLGTAVGLLVFAMGVAVLAGHLVYYMARLAQIRAVELETLSATLARGFDGRTRELRLLAAHVERLREDERAAIARDLHDELGQILTGMRMELDLAERVRTRAGDLRPHHDRLAVLLDGTLASARSIVEHLRPRILDDFGLVAALDWLVTDTRRSAGLDVRFTASPADFTVPPEVATGVFRMVQESLTNVQRHADAREVQVAVTLRDGLLEASVQDDGRGFPPDEARRLGSMGLLGMRERARSLGGELELGAGSGGGALVTVRVPLQTPAEVS